MEIKKKKRLIVGLTVGIPAAAGLATALGVCVRCSTEEFITIPSDKLNISGDTLKGLKENADVSKYTTLEIPSEVRNIEKSAFKDVFKAGSTVTTVKFNRSIRKLGDSIFENCNGITTFDLSEIDEESAKYIDWGNNIFGTDETNKPVYINVKFNDTLTDTAKETLKNKLLAAGVPAASFAQKVTDKIEVKSEDKTKEVSDVAKLEMTLSMTEEEKLTYVFKATADRDGGTPGVGVKLGEVKVEEITNDAKKYKASVEAEMVNAKNNGDYVTYKVDMIAMAGNEVKWVQTIENFKLVYNKELPPSVVHVTGISLDATSSNLLAGETQTLVPTITPADATDKSVEWKSSDKNIATVDENGKITAVAEGSATITVVTKDGEKTASCVVNVGKTLTKEAFITQYETFVASYKTPAQGGISYNSADLTTGDKFKGAVAPASVPVEYDQGTPYAIFGDGQDKKEMMANIPSSTITGLITELGDDYDTKFGGTNDNSWVLLKAVKKDDTNIRVIYKVDSNSYVVEHVDNRNSGSETILHLTGKTGEKSVKNLELEGTSAHKTEFKPGDKFSTSGIKLTATYADETTEIITSGFTQSLEEGYEFTDAEVGTYKTIKITFAHGGAQKSIEYQIHIGPRIDINTVMGVKNTNDYAVKMRIAKVSQYEYWKYWVYSTDGENYYNFSSDNITIPANSSLYLKYRSDNKAPDFKGSTGNAPISFAKAEGGDIDNGSISLEGRLTNIIDPAKVNKLDASCFDSGFINCQWLGSVSDNFLPSTITINNSGKQTFMRLFKGCKYLRNVPTISIDGRGATTTNASTCNAMFEGCESLTDVSNISITVNAVKSDANSDFCYYMFADCKKLKTPAKYTLAGRYGQAGDTYSYGCGSSYKNASLITKLNPTDPEIQSGEWVFWYKRDSNVAIYGYPVDTNDGNVYYKIQQ